MTRPHSASVLFLAWLMASPLQAASPIPEALKAPAKAPDQSVKMTRATPWRLSAGPQWRSIQGVSFENQGSHVADYRLPSLGIKSTSSTADGYVLSDITGSSTLTWNWGYTNASQIQGGNLVISGTGATRLLQDFQQTLNTDWDDDEQSWGGFVQLESPELLRLGAVSFSAVAGYSYTPFDFQHNANAFRAVQRAIIGQSFTQTYSLGGIAVPPAPHAGNFVGPGPVINLQPVQSSGGGAGQIIDRTFLSTLTQELDVDVHTLSFGPQASLERGRLRGTLGLGLALNIAAWDAQNVEVLTQGEKRLERWQDSASSTDVLPGFYLQAGAEYALSQRVAVISQARYDWSQNLEGKVGHSDFSVNLSGWTLGIALQYRF